MTLDATASRADFGLPLPRPRAIGMKSWNWLGVAPFFLFAFMFLI